MYFSHATIKVQFVHVYLETPIYLFPFYVFSQDFLRFRVCSCFTNYVFLHILALRVKKNINPLLLGGKKSSYVFTQTYSSKLAVDESSHDLLLPPSIKWLIFLSKILSIVWM